MKIGLAQYDFTVGDLQGNLAKILRIYHEAEKQLLDLLIFPELALCGYIPEDLLLRDDFLSAAKETLNTLTAHVHQCAIVIGCSQQIGDKIYNAAFVLQHEKIIASYHKNILPNYAVFDEKRYFTEGSESCVFQLNGKGPQFGLLICEDVWFDGPAMKAKAAGAEVLLSIHASPYSMSKEKLRENIYAKACQITHLPMLLSLSVGAQDDLCFDGGSRALNAEGECLAKAPFFQEQTLVVDLHERSPKNFMIQAQTLPAPQSSIAYLYQALVLGVRDYVRKNGFNGALLGLSGGIDSSLTLMLAIDALGVEQVTPVFLPSRFTSELSDEGVKEQLTLTGAKGITMSIEAMFESTLQTLAPTFEGLPKDITEENIQARCRGILLMALSNKTGKILLTTGNKSEMAMGYATLYGDMAGGFAALKDVPKTCVFELARYRNTLGYVIPRCVIDRPPSAELAEGQRDEDSLPPYPVLDEILHRLIDLKESIEAIVAAGFDEITVKRVASALYRNEYKRRQSPPGIKVTTISFTRERRYPMTSGKWWE